MSSIIFDIDLVHQCEPDPILTECHILNVIPGSRFLTSKLVARKGQDCELVAEVEDVKQSLQTLVMSLRVPALTCNVDNQHSLPFVLGKFYLK